MKTGPVGYTRSALLLAALGMSALLSSVARAGDVYLTGHDTLLHSGQNGYDAVIIDYLRGAAAKASYDIGVVGTISGGSAKFTGQGADITSVGHGGAIPLTGTLSGYGSAKFYDAAMLAADPGKAAVLAGLDLLIVLSHTSCGGCSLTNVGSTALNGMATDIATAFNAGMDIWGNSGAALPTYYDFLPPGAVASGAPIGGSSGFVATPAGTSIGITDSMINGFPTHNRFTSQASAFTVFEVRPQTGDPDEIISIGLRDGVISTGGITTGGITTGGTTVPDSGSAALLLALALPALGYLRRKIRS